MRKTTLGGLVVAVLAGVAAAQKVTPTGWADTVEMAFDFEDQRGTWSGAPAGGLKALELERCGLGLRIERSLKTPFDLADNRAPGQDKPSGWGNITLDPFSAPAVLDTFVITFSQPVLEFSLEFGDYGGDLDIVTLTGLSGKDATGEVVAFASGFWLNDLHRHPPGFVRIEGPLQSVVVTGGSASFAHSVYYDNLRAVVPGSALPSWGVPMEIDPRPGAPRWDGPVPARRRFDGLTPHPSRP